MAEVIFWLVWAIVMVAGPVRIVAPVVEAVAYRLAGVKRCKTPCCDACNGTGSSYDIETNGRCWDCYGTGHAHLT